MGKLLITLWLSSEGTSLCLGSPLETQLVSSWLGSGFLQALLTAQTGGGLKKKQAVVGRQREHAERNVSGPSSDSHWDLRQLLPLLRFPQLGKLSVLMGGRDDWPTEGFANCYAIIFWYSVQSGFIPSYCHPLF